MPFLCLLKKRKVKSFRRLSSASLCSLPCCIQTARVMGWCEKEIPLLHPSMTSLPMAISQETQQPPSVAHLSTLYISLKTDRGQTGYGEPCSIFQQEMLEKQHLRNYTWQESENFRASWWVPEKSLETSAREASKEEQDFTAVGQNKEITK